MATTKKMLGIIYIPTSNADSGCIILMLKKIQTDMRSELKNETKCVSMVTEQNQESEF